MSAYVPIAQRVAAGVPDPHTADTVAHELALRGALSYVDVAGRIAEAMEAFRDQSRALLLIFRQTAGHLAYLNRVMRRYRRRLRPDYRTTRMHRAYRAKQQRSTRR